MSATHAPACLAADMQLYLSPDGNVRTCCRNHQPVGNVAESSLREIWDGELRRARALALGRGAFPEGCEACGREVAAEGRERSYLVVYDRFLPLAADGPRAWPARIEFNLSNTCNLMCAQCDGLLSSMIRAHREQLPPLPPVYGDAFFADLEEFVPHLHEVQFAGGEPFLARENFRAWDLIERLHPTLPCTVITNATQWNDRIARVGSTLHMGFTFSIDGITKETYESVRVNSDLERVLANVERYSELARGHGAELEVNFCLMRQNHHEFGELLLWAEERGMLVNVSVVRSPEHCSIASLPPGELRAVSERLDAADASVRPQLVINRATWDAELSRIRAWARSPQAVRDGLYWRPPEGREVPVDLLPGSSLGLHLNSLDEVDRDEAVATLAAWADDATVHRIELDFQVDRPEGDHCVTDVSESVVALLGAPAPELIGCPLSAVAERAEDRFGPVAEVETVPRSARRPDSETRYERALIRAIVVPRRTERGRLVAATMLFAVRPA